MLQLISQEMTNETLVIRKHIDDLTAKSQLIVYESQEAVFVKNGQALDLFAAGRYTLDTANIPLIKKFFANLFGGSAPFPCDIFFINKVSQLDFMWGTDAPIDLADPKYSMLVGVRANGQTGFRISDSRRFITKVVGMLNEYTAEALKKTVKGLILAPIKECIAQTIIEKQVSILEITPRLTEISSAIQNKLNSRISDLGITIEHFNVNAIMASDGDMDALRKAKADMLSGMNEANIEAYKIRTVSAARAEARATEGYTYADERRYDVLEGAAKNEGVGGSLMNMGVGLGVGSGVGGAVGQMVDKMIVNPTSSNNAVGEAVCSGCGANMPAGSKFCMNCGQPRPTAKFCPECGTKAQDGAKFCMNCGTKLS